MLDENYTRAVAGLQIYDVLLVNSIADGMNLVAKEGAVVNQRHGAVVLSERTGAFQQLQSGVLVVSPLDVYGTAEALYQALTMPVQQRRDTAAHLYTLVERHDIVDWLHQQLATITRLNL